MSGDEPFSAKGGKGTTLAIEDMHKDQQIRRLSDGLAAALRKADEVAEANQALERRIKATREKTRAQEKESRSRQAELEAKVRHLESERDFKAIQVEELKASVDAAQSQRDEVHESLRLQVFQLKEELRSTGEQQSRLSGLQQQLDEQQMLVRTYEAELKQTCAAIHRLEVSEMEHRQGTKAMQERLQKHLGRADAILLGAEEQQHRIKELRMERDTIEASATAAREAAEGRYEALREELKGTKEALEREIHDKERKLEEADRGRAEAEAGLRGLKDALLKLCSECSRLVSDHRQAPDEASGAADAGGGAGCLDDAHRALERLASMIRRQNQQQNRHHHHQQQQQTVALMSGDGSRAPPHPPPSQARPGDQDCPPWTNMMMPSVAPDRDSGGTEGAPRPALSPAPKRQRTTVCDASEADDDGSGDNSSALVGQRCREGDEGGEGEGGGRSAELDGGSTASSSRDGAYSQRCSPTGHGGCPSGDVGELEVENSPAEEDGEAVEEVHVSLALEAASSRQTEHVRRNNDNNAHASPQRTDRQHASAALPSSDTVAPSPLLLMLPPPLRRPVATPGAPCRHGATAPNADDSSSSSKHDNAGTAHQRALPPLQSASADLPSAATATGAADVVPSAAGECGPSMALKVQQQQEERVESNRNPMSDLFASFDAPSS